MTLYEDLRAPESAPPNDPGAGWWAQQSKWFRGGAGAFGVGSFSLVYDAVRHDGMRSPFTDLLTAEHLVIALVGLAVVLSQLRGKQLLVTALCAGLGLTAVVTALELDARRGPAGQFSSKDCAPYYRAPAGSVFGDPIVCAGREGDHIRIEANGFEPGSTLKIQMRGRDLWMAINSQGRGTATTRQGRGHAHVRGITGDRFRFNSELTIYRYPLPND